MVVNRSESHIPRKSFPMLSPGYIRNLLGKHGLDDKTVGALTHTLTTIFNKFAVDERLNYDVIEKFMGGDFGGGQRCATVTVAASDGSELSKATADYVCDGTDDHVEIQAGLDQVVNGAGGLLLLLDGNFQLGDTITVESPASHYNVEGLGLATVLVGSNTRPTFDIQASGAIFRFSNMFFANGGPAIQWMTRDDGGTIDHCRFEDCATAIATIYETPATWLDYYVHILHNEFHDCGFGVPYAVDLQQRTWGLEFVGNNFDGTHGLSECLRIDADDAGSVQVGQHVRIANNMFDRNVLIRRHNTGTLTGNTFDDSLELDTCSYWGITGNVLFGTYTETTVGAFEKAGNYGII